jgi:hypothetical protein
MLINFVTAVLVPPPPSLTVTLTVRASLIVDVLRNVIRLSRASVAVALALAVVKVTVSFVVPA